MEDKFLKVLFIAGVIALVGTICLMRLHTAADHILPVLKSVVGKSEEEVVARLGVPARRLTLTEYSAWRRLGGGLSEPLPSVECDFVLLYSHGLRRSFIFFRNGVVIDIFSAHT